MKKLVTIGLAGAIALALGSTAMAGNNPNWTRTLTGGIGSGTTHGRIPASHPATRSRAAQHRNSHAADYTSKYRNGISHLPSSSSGGAALASGSRPTTIPASIPSQAASHVPATIGGRPEGTGGGSIPSSSPPTAIPATVPSQAASHVPTTIGGQSAGSSGFAVTQQSIPATIPATLPDQSGGHPPSSIGGSSGGYAVSNPPPAAIPAPVPNQALGHTPASIGRP